MLYIQSYVVLDKILHPALAISVPLLPPILLRCFWMCFPVLRLIARVGFAPLPLAIANYLGVVRVCDEFLPVIISAALTLAVGRAANSLLQPVL
jgi:hypothetical protein